MKKNTKNLKTSKKNTKSKIKSGKERNIIEKKGTIHDKFEAYFHKSNNIFFFISLILTVIFGILLFNVKVSTGGDDSEYILRALAFMRGEHFPTFQGSFYPIFLSFWIAIFNMDLVQLIILLKVISMLLIIGHLVFMYLAFKDHISPSTLTFVMIFVSINAYVLYYGSQTYSEALFLFLQALAFYLLTQSLDIFNIDSENNLRIGKWFLFSLIMFLLVQTRNVGYAMLFTVLAYLLMYKKFRITLYALGSYISYAFVFTLYKLIFWNIKPSDTGGRLELILLKDTYNPGAGTEDFKGMIVRFVENAKIFLSKQISVILGFAKDTGAKNNAFLTVVIILVLIGILIYTWKKSKSVKFVGLYLLFSLGITFISLQQRWGQLRLILVYVPLILLFIGGGLSLLAKKKYAILHYLYLSILFVSILLSFSVTTERTSENSKVLNQNLQGDMYYGFTPDWIHYLQMCLWTGKNLPEDAVVACRKPSIASIYANGRKFYRINKVPSVPTQPVVKDLLKKGGDYYVMKLNELESKKLPPQLMLAVRRNIYAMVAVDQAIYGIFKFTGNQTVIVQMLSEKGVPMEQDLEKFLRVTVNMSSKTYTYIPENMLMQFYNKDVNYVIRANLRRNPNKYTGQTITTVAYYLRYVDYKYPGIFKVYYQIGGNKPENEPATLYKIDYQNYGIGK